MAQVHRSCGVRRLGCIDGRECPIQEQRPSVKTGSALCGRGPFGCTYSDWSGVTVSRFWCASLHPSSVRGPDLFQALFEGLGVQQWPVHISPILVVPTQGKSAFNKHGSRLKGGDALWQGDIDAFSIDNSLGSSCVPFLHCNHWCLLRFWTHYNFPFCLWWGL